MNRVRVIPCLQLADERLVKTVKFKKGQYIGDPVNTVKIFNDLEVDELCLLDIEASGKGAPPAFHLLEQIANECFMPLSYGGGISSFEDAKRLFTLGFEKIVLNTAAVKKPELITKIADYWGSQATVVSVDVKKNLFGKYEVYTSNGKEKITGNIVEWAQEVAEKGAGEILLTSMDRDGTWAGYDVPLTRSVSAAVTIPVIANGGAGNPEHIRQVITEGGASAVALSSMLIYQQKDMGVLINYPKGKIRAAIHSAQPHTYR